MPVNARAGFADFRLRANDDAVQRFARHSRERESSRDLRQLRPTELARKMRIDQGRSWGRVRPSWLRARQTSAQQAESSYLPVAVPSGMSLTVATREVKMLGWSLRIGTIAGIRIYAHWTFLLLIGAILFVYIIAGQTLVNALLTVGFVLAIFGCVVLHELGHALAARRYGVPTKDITLLPIGGVARLQRMPEHPTQELVVALAGPAVNVVIAAILFAVLLVLRGATLWQNPLEPANGNEMSFLARLMWVNVFLVLFNMLPAFPMDGGRVLRALLAQRMDYGRATNIAASVGQGMAILFAMVGLLLPHVFLLFIALFVYLGAQGEAQLVQMRLLLRDVPVREAMLRRFRTLSVHDTLQHATDELLAGSQQDFPVIEDGQLRGILRRDDLVQGLKQSGREEEVGHVMSTNCTPVDAYDMLDRVMERMREQPCSTMPVVHNGQLVGLVTLENVGELMMIRSALRESDLPTSVEEYEKAA
jgi:Zn-dependent protease/CBS domain-containing protein